jgi:hypothetical protein
MAWYASDTGTAASSKIETVVGTVVSNFDEDSTTYIATIWNYPYIIKVICDQPRPKEEKQESKPKVKGRSFPPFVAVRKRAKKYTRTQSGRVAGYTTGFT